jgi:predicted  nucleic acid-binding Zn-ribbon protein
MKVTLFKIVFTASVLAFAVTSCSDELAKTSNENVNNTGAKADVDKMRAEEMEAYKKESRDKIAANEKIISDLKARVNMSTQDARDNYNRKIEMLEKRNNELKAKLESLQDRTAEEWNEFKKEFNHDMSELGEAFEDLTKNNVK